MSRNEENNSAFHGSLKHIFQKSTVTFFVKLAGLIAGFFFTFIVTRFYGNESFGLFSICLNIVQFFILITVFGFDNTLLKITAPMRDSADYTAIRRTYKQMVKLLVVPGLIFACLLFLGSDWIAAHIFNKNGLAAYLRLASFLVLPNSLMLLHASGLRGLNKTGWFSFFRETSRFLIALPVLFLLIILYADIPAGPMIAYLSSALIAFLWSFVIWRKYLGPITGLPELKQLSAIKSIFNLAIPFFLISLFGQMTPLLNSLLLGIMGTAAEVGIFNVALKIAGLLSLPLLAVNLATANSFAEMSEMNKRKLLENVISKSSSLIFWTSLPMLLACLMLPGKIMGVFGSNSGEGSSTLLIIASAQFVNVITGSVGVIMQMTGHENIWMKILFGTTLLNIISMIILVPMLGITGAAISFLLVMVINNITGAVYLNRKLKINTFYIPFLK